MVSKAISSVLVALQLACIVWIVATGGILAKNPWFLCWELGALALGAWAIGAMRLGNINVMPEVKQGARLVQGGPYRYVRHPMYTALLLATLAVVLDDFSSARLAAWIILLLTLLVKLEREERFLAEHFSEYTAYRRVTKKLIPFLY